MKQIGWIVGLSVAGFAVVLVALIAGRLSAEEVALLAGVVCGIGVAIPVGVVAGTAVATRRRCDVPADALPAIYVVQAPTPTMVGAPPTLPALSQTRPAGRTLNIIGQTSLDADE